MHGLFIFKKFIKMWRRNEENFIKSPGNFWNEVKVIVKSLKSNKIAVNGQFLKENTIFVEFPLSARQKETFDEISFFGLGKW